MNFQEDISPHPIRFFKDHNELLFDLTSMQDGTENCPYPELVGEQLRLEVNFMFPLEIFTELIVLREQISLVADDKFCLVGENV